MDATRIDVRRLVYLLIVTLLLPPLIGAGLDIYFGTVPFFTIGSGVLSIPLATFTVLRSTLTEFNRVVQILAPEPIDEDKSPGKALPDGAVAGFSVTDLSERMGIQPNVEGENQ